MMRAQSTNSAPYDHQTGSESNFPEITFDISRYVYTEPGVMQSTSDPVFLSLGLRKWDKAAGNESNLRKFYTAEITRGWTQYTGSGTLDEDYYKFRGEGYLGYQLGDITPYLGLGYRWLYDDSGGKTTSTGASSYDRMSQYIYTPIGIIYNYNKKLKFKAQYNLFLYGRQTSYLSDVPKYTDVENNQRNGWGLDFTIDNKITEKFTVYTYFRYWNIKRSDTATGTYAGIITFNAYEPHNTTDEMGIGVSYKF